MTSGSNAGAGGDLAAGDAHDHRWRLSAPALGCTALGVALLLASFLGARWFEVEQPEGGQALIPFTSLDSLYFRSPTAGLRTHFQTLAWVCAITALVGAAGSSARSRASRALAALGEIAVAAGVVLILFEVRVTDGVGYFRWLAWAAEGLWFGIAGLMLLGTAAVINHRRAEL